MRGVAKPENYRGESLFRTMAMAMVIAGFICFAAMFWCLYRAAPEGAGVAYYLPWCLPYGIVDLAIAGTGVAFTTLSKEKPSLYKPGEIIGIVMGGLLVVESFPLVISLGNVEFFISVLVIGACVIVIAALGLAQMKENS